MKPKEQFTPSHAELADLLEQQLDSREPYSLRMTTGRAIVKALRESSTTTVVEILGHEGKAVSARCILSGCQDFALSRTAPKRFQDQNRLEWVCERLAQHSMYIKQYDHAKELPRGGFAFYTNSTLLGYGETIVDAIDAAMKAEAGL